MEIIQLTSEQWAEYKELRLKALKDDPEAFGSTYDEIVLRTDDEWRMMLEKTSEGQRRWVFFAQQNGKLVGMISGTSLIKIPDAVKIQEMFVVKEQRGKGIATKLIQRLETELLKHTDKRLLRLGVFNTQVDAINLYKDLGFKILEEKTEHFSSGVTHESLIMEKILN